MTIKLSYHVESIFMPEISVVTDRNSEGTTLTLTFDRVVAGDYCFMDLKRMYRHIDETLRLDLDTTTTDNQRRARDQEFLQICYTFGQTWGHGAVPDTLREQWHGAETRLGRRTTNFNDNVGRRIVASTRLPTVINDAP